MERAALGLSSDPGLTGADSQTDHPGRREIQAPEGYSPIAANVVAADSPSLSSHTLSVGQEVRTDSAGPAGRSGG